MPLIKRDSIEWKCSVLNEKVSNLKHDVFVINEFHEDLSDDAMVLIDAALRDIRALSKTTGELTRQIFWPRKEPD